MYLYESHLGSLFTSDELYDYDQLYCEQCGDSDNYLGDFDTLQELWDLIQDDCATDDYKGGWSMQYIYVLLYEQFPKYLHKPTYEQGNCLWCTESNETLLKYIENGIKKEKENN